MKTISGSCLCGQIRYEYTGEPGLSSYCHCSDCRKVTGSAFIVSIRLDVKDLRFLTNDKTKSYTKIADSGNSITRNFCPNCGSPVFTTSKDNPEYIWVRAGTLDDPTFIKPAYEYWTDSKVEWATIPEKIERFNKGRR